MPTITPWLWFDDQAEEAVNFYVSVFAERGRNRLGLGESKILSTTRYGEAGPREPGTVMTVEFQLEGQRFAALNGGPEFNFTEAVSFMVDCEDQAEVDHLWNALTGNGGEESQCGWLKDRFGVSWQIIPKALNELLNDPDPEKAQRVMKAMLEMRKIDIEGLEKAHQGA